MADLIKQIEVNNTIYDVYDNIAIHQDDELITTSDIDAICKQEGLDISLTGFSSSDDGEGNVVITS